MASHTKGNLKIHQYPVSLQRLGFSWCRDGGGSISILFESSPSELNVWQVENH